MFKTEVSINFVAKVVAAKPEGVVLENSSISFSLDHASFDGKT